MKKINKNIETEYRNALQASPLDSSEYILLLMGYLASKFDNYPEVNKALQQARNHFINYDYNQAIAVLQHTANQHSQAIPHKMLIQFSEKSKQLLDDPRLDHNRRFFETRLSENVEKHIIATHAFKSVESLVPIMKWHDARIKVTEKVNTFEDAQQILLYVCRLNDNIELGLKLDASQYKKKDRSAKEQVTFSRNTGVMRSITPNFYDLLSKETKQGRVVDKFRVSTTKPGFSAENQAIPFVNSISGTTFTLVVLLDDYMQSKANDPDLQNNINDIVKSFISLYVKNGFHSLGEITTILQSSKIRAIFDKYNVKLDFTLPEQAYLQAFDEAQSYTKTTCLKKAMQQELKSKRPKHPEHEPQPTVKTPSVNEFSVNELGLIKGKPIVFSDRPANVYVRFASAEEANKVVNAINKAYGPTAARVTSYQEMTGGPLLHIELMNDQLKRSWQMYLKSQPSQQQIASKVQKSDATLIKTLGLENGKQKIFEGDRARKIYIQFTSTREMQTAVDAINAKFGANAARVSNYREQSNSPLLCLELIDNKIKNVWHNHTQKQNAQNKRPDPFVILNQKPSVLTKEVVKIPDLAKTIVKKRPS